ncbi:MAG: oligosaccharide flippase family protein [Symploca sp. SIO1C2]|nr:oligosaccharide flippase family protein [Symploca sp. SIO1C2]
MSAAQVVPTLMIQSTQIKTSPQVRLKDLAKGTITALSLQISGVLLTYLAQIVLARWMGKVEYGIYAFILALSALLAIPSGFGFPRTVLRFMAEYRVQEDWGRLRGILQGSWQFTLGMSFCICLISTGIIGVLDYYQNISYTHILYIGIWLVPLQALMLLHEEMSRGANSLIRGYTPSKIVWPLLAILGGFYLERQRHTLDSTSMTEFALIALLVVIALQLLLLWNRFDQEILSSEAIYEPRQWLKVALPLLLIQSFREILTESDTLMVGGILGSSAVGVYDAACKTALWVNLILKSVNLLAAPAFVTLYTQKKLPDLQKIVSAITWWIFWPSLIISLVFILLAQPILGLFGSGFSSGSWALRILVFGQLMSAICGSVGNLMMMTGHQNDTLVASASCALINLVANAIMIPLFGLAGAAFTTMFTLILWNVWLSYLVVHKIGIYPSIFASLLGGRRQDAGGRRQE